MATLKPNRRGVKAPGARRFVVQNGFCGTKTEYIRARILDEHFRVVTVDKSREDFVRRLTEFTAALNKIGVLYNQAVCAINSYHSDKVACVLLERFERYSARIVALQEESVRLIIDFCSR